MDSNAMRGSDDEQMSSNRRSRVLDEAGHAAKGSETVELLAEVGDFEFNNLAGMPRVHGAPVLCKEMMTPKHLSTKPTLSED